MIAPLVVLILLQDPAKDMAIVHRTPITSVAFSADGKLCATGGAITVWTLATRAEHMRVGGDKESAILLAFSPDAKFLLSLDGAAAHIKLWDVATGQLARNLDGHAGAVQFAAFTANGKCVVSFGQDNAIRVWNPLTGDPMANVACPPATALALGGDGQTLVVCSADHTVRFYKAASGQKIREVSLSAKMGVGERVTCLALSHDGATLVTGILSEGAMARADVRIWDAATGRLVRGSKVHDKLSAIALSPDGQRIVSCGEGGRPEVKLWSASTGELIARHEQAGPCAAVSFTPDGRRLASAEDRTLTIRAPRAKGKPPAEIFCDSLPKDAFAVSRNGRHFAAVKPGLTRVWDLAKKQMVIDLKGAASGHVAAFRPDDKFLAIGTVSGARLLEVPTGKEARIFPTDNDAGAVTGVAYTPDGKLLVVATAGGQLKVWDAVAGKELRTWRAPEAMYSMALDPAGTCVYTGGDQNRVTCWSLEKGEKIGTPFKVGSDRCRIECMTWGADAKGPLVACNDGTVALVTSDGPSLYFSDSGDVCGGSFKFWCAYSSDGRQMAFVTRSRSVVVWDVQKVAPYMELESVGGPIVFTADSKSLISSSIGNNIYIWKLRD